MNVNLDAVINIAMRACFALARNLQTEITYQDVKEIEGWDYDGNVTKRFKITIKFPKGAPVDFTIDDNQFTPDILETLSGVFMRVHMYKDRMPEGEFIILCMAAWFLNYGEEMKLL